MGHQIPVGNHLLFLAWNPFSVFVFCYFLPFFFGRHFCGWLCPAGFFTEYLNKLIPRKWQIPFNKLNLKAVRLGFLTAFIIIPLLGLGNMCCAYCNFNVIQGVFGLASFNMNYLSVFSTRIGWVMLGWVIIFGVLSKGGRVNCDVFCPPGIVSSIFYWLGSRFKFTRKFIINADVCKSCATCEQSCVMNAIDSKQKTIDYTACISCNLCQQACPNSAINYKTGKINKYEKN